MKAVRIVKCIADQASERPGDGLVSWTNQRRFSRIKSPVAHEKNSFAKRSSATLPV